MNAAIFQGPNNITVRNDLIIPTNGVIVRVKAAGVCGYDARVYRRGHTKVSPPIILGHEICGEILESYTTVDGSKLKAGTRVAVSPLIPCLNCRFCHIRQFNLCLNLNEIGSSTNGGFAEYLKIPDQTLKINGLIPIPDNLNNEEGALLEPLACCLNSFSQMGPINKDSTIAVIGDGPIGLLHLQLAKLFGAKVIVIGKIPLRLYKAKVLGADEIIINDDRANRLIREAPINAVIVATSNPDAIDFALKIAGRKSIINLFAGMPKGAKLNIDANWLHYNQISITGSFSSTPDMLREATRLVSSQKINLSEIITHRFSLDSVREAIEVTEKYLGLRAVINEF